VIERIVEQIARYGISHPYHVLRLITSIYNNPEEILEIIQGTVAAPAYIVRMILKKYRKMIDKMGVRVVLIGQNGTGKTSLINCFGSGESEYRETVMKKQEELPNVKAFELDDIVNDTSGRDLQNMKAIVYKSSVVLYLIKYPLLLNDSLEDTQLKPIREDLEHLMYWMQKGNDLKKKIYIVITFCDKHKKYNPLNVGSNQRIYKIIESCPVVVDIVNLIGRSNTTVICGSLLSAQSSIALATEILWNIKSGAQKISHREVIE